MTKIGIRVWLLFIFLALAFLTILNGPAQFIISGAILILLIPVILTKIKSKAARVVALLVFIVCMYFIITLSVQPGVVVKSVESNSEAFEAGLRQEMIITGINSLEIENFEDYSNAISNQFQNKTGPVRLTITTNVNEFVYLANESPDIIVSDISRTRVKTGLDLSGGARAIVRPINVTPTSSEMADLISVTNQRLNAFGISDVTVREVTDLQGNRFMLVEIAGATPEELRDLISQQGKFEAKIGNQTVFVGGDKDITNVCRNDATCAAVTSCSQQGGEHFCQFQFSITLSSEAAKRHADITRGIPLDASTGNRYLVQNLTLVLDDVIVDQLLISSGLRGQVTSQISIQGSGTGATQEEAYDNARSEMNKLQTILITGSIPFKLEIIKLDSISPLLGKEFARSLLLLGLVVFLLVAISIFIRYRKIKITLSVVLTMFSEAFITLAIAALINWNLDAPSIAGIIAGIGIGVNDQIIIIDEYVSNRETSVRERIRRALFIIIGAFFTIVAAMLPLFWAGAGLLRGFALTTIIGVSVGILITRPAFADILKKLQPE